MLLINMSHISTFHLPPNDNCLIVTALKSFNFLSFSGHLPKTGSVANFLSFDFFVRNSIYDILWIIILKKKGSSHILDNAITLLLTLQFNRHLLLHDCLAEKNTQNKTAF